MKSLEYISTCTALAGIAFIFTMWQPAQHPALLAAPHEQMLCPDVAIKHSVGNNLRTGVQMVDKCSAHLNLVKY